MFVATSCPGPYLQSKFPYIAEEVNKRLQPQTPEPDAPSDWAIDAWDWAKSRGLMDGTSPQGAATREQVATLFYRWVMLDGTGVR